MYKQIYLKRGKEDSLKRFHPWVFSGAIHHADDGIEEGDTVRVITSSGDFIAVGHYQIGSIAVRVLSFRDVTVDSSFWESRIRSALRLRVAMGIADNSTNNTYRLVHGEGDNLPGLVVDVYGKTAVMQAHSVGMHICRMDVAQAIVKVSDGRIENIYYKSETTLPFKADLGQENGFIYGSSDDNTAMENGLRFHVDWLKGQKTGFFVDQRENRSLLERYSYGRKVLNMFCYTGGFSFYAMRGGASLVHSVDSSAKAIELTRRNVELNFPGDTRHEAFCEDAFKYLDEAGSHYDIVILDPPAFAKHRGAIRNALKGYCRLNAKAFEKIKSGGILFTFSCSQVITKDNFRNAVFTAAAMSGRKVRILHQLHQPADHPINIYHPEGEYLKGLVLYVE
ncbi:class I SAM-dependent rRNA methyltransferase [Xylanibacter rodentium]|jgi:23S rRNA (cytosine1962-C5)-methyltransferase|uniref:Class I SAM-dependent rRNA methyltransferase n=2 Tax=Xylanibacter rodentium TaxID=2736289 RepID=A0ABX2ATR2_9BACT|nr:class I SAM-dependent rRNA methyltransferase [Xylanibacter rodentium]NPE11023.1 class I SAM-dependent rRNA methyltransferase [Prevotella sp. PJ1A]NPE14129.1 class I SAM-dependent rRNA methyltransferase [Xylanibacter rodentium]NPE37435.1 class I SAM-dependent rRNA methyltransferase [Prevotella sp. PCJ2]